MGNGAGRSRHDVYGLSQIGGFDDRKASQRQEGRHERTIRRLKVSSVRIAHLHRKARDTHQHTVFAQLGIVRVGRVSNGSGGTVVALLVSISNVTNLGMGVPFRPLMLCGACPRAVHPNGTAAIV
jgi:hypothetical protein